MTHAKGSARTSGRFRRTLVVGLGLILPPLLTVVILLWVFSTLMAWVIQPAMVGAGNLLSRSLADVRTSLPGGVADPNDPTQVTSEGRRFKRLANGQFIPLDVYNTVLPSAGMGAVSTSGEMIYRRYVDIRYLQRHWTLPVFLCLFVLLMYLAGSLFAAGAVRILDSTVQRAVNRVPFVRVVYNSLRRVTDSMVAENELPLRRVIALEYPGKGVWALAFVMGEGMPEVSAAAGEPVLSILVPTSPIPFKGYTMMIRKSQAIDVDLTVEQACQFIMSLGAVTSQRPEGLSAGAGPPVHKPPVALGDNQTSNS